MSTETSSSTSAPASAAASAPATSPAAGVPIPTWARRGLALVAILAGWSFVAWHNRFYLTPSVVLLALGWAAVVSTVYLLWRVGVAGGASEEHADEWWTEATPREDLEREKRTLLRTLRDVEFDQQTGKLSQRDADELSAVTRARAIEVMKALDAADAGSDDVRAQIERALRARREIEAARKAGRKGKGKGKKPEPASKPAAESAARQEKQDTKTGAPIAGAVEEPAPIAAAPAPTSDVEKSPMDAGVAEQPEASDDKSGPSGASEETSASDATDGASEEMSASNASVAAALASGEGATTDTAKASEGSV